MNDADPVVITVFVVVLGSGIFVCTILAILHAAGVT